MDNDTPHTHPPTALQPLPPLPPSVSAHVNSDKSVTPFASLVIPMPEKEPVTARNMTLFNLLDKGTAGPQGQQADVLPLCPSLVSSLQSLCPEFGHGLLTPLAFRNLSVQQFFYRAGEAGRGGRTRGRYCKWSGVAGILGSTGCVLSCIKKQRDQQESPCERGFCPSTLLLWDSHLGSPLETLTSIHLWSPQDRKDINWIQRRTTKLIRGIEYLFCKERLRKLGLLSLKSEDFGVI